MLSSSSSSNLSNAFESCLCKSVLVIGTSPPGSAALLFHGIVPLPPFLLPSARSASTKAKKHPLHKSNSSSGSSKHSLHDHLSPKIYKAHPSHVLGNSHASLSISSATPAMFSKCLLEKFTDFFLLFTLLRLFFFAGASRPSALQPSTFIVALISKLTFWCTCKFTDTCCSFSPPLAIDPSTNRFLFFNTDFSTTTRSSSSSSSSSAFMISSPFGLDF
mmetsp:Transcript_49/g.155  ORF Transcript_49/g.155 Transcript_49/m.155 type:complete len:218 (+) Transcript_49:2199-2852(+)